MNNYAFEILSPIRFEQLARDLLRVKYGDFENLLKVKMGGLILGILNLTAKY